MINSRSLDDLLPIVKAKVEKFIRVCHNEGIDLLVTSTYRDNESQDALYAQGRTTAGHIVTNAKAGDSFHNYRCAVDVVPLRNGKAVWNTSGEDGKLWATVGDLGESCGLAWAGRWTGKMRELAHFQYTAGHSLADLKKGAVIN